MKYRIRVKSYENGELTVLVDPSERIMFFYDLSQLNLKTVLGLEITRWYKPKTSQQMRLLRKIERVIARATGNDLDGVHEGLKWRACEMFPYPMDAIPFTGRDEPKSAADISTKEIDYLMQTAAVVAGEEGADIREYLRDYGEIRANAKS